MRSVLLAMTEEHHENRTWRSSIFVGAFILLTLALNASTREQAALIRIAYNNSNDSVLLIFITTVVAAQIIAAVVIITAETLRGDLPDKEAVMIIIFSHAGTIFLHGYLLSLGDAHNFLTVSFFQLILVLITLFIVTSLAARPIAWISMSFICISCSLMSVKFSTIINPDRASLICILSAFSLILRNIVIRQLVGVENVSIRIRRKRVISGLAVSACIFLLLVRIFLSPIWLFPSLCAIITCALSSSLVYVTTQILKSYTVPFVSLFCVWAVVLEAILLTPRDHRPDVLTFVMALVLCSFGHYLFIKDHIEQTAGSGNVSSLVVKHPPKPAHTHEQYTRIEFLLFASLVLGVIFFVFQPQVSQRDLVALSYVGLDKVIRRLLMHHIKEDVHMVEEEGKVQLP